MKRGDQNELERKLSLEKVVSRKQLSLAVEMEEERRARLENDAALPSGSGFPWIRTKKRKTEECGSYHAAQVGPGNRGSNKSKKKIGFGLDLIWIEIEVFIFQGMNSLAL